MGANHFAIILAAVIIGAAILATQFVGRYQIAAASGTDGSPFVWRLDTRTGEIQSCTFSKITNPFDRIDPNGGPDRQFRMRCNKDFAP